MPNNFPYESYVLLAFRNLKVFSIPEIGTFVRKTLPARLDDTQKIIYPPREYIEFLPKQYQQLSAFSQLLEQSLNLPSPKAQEVVSKIGKLLTEYLEKQKEITLGNIGKLKYLSASQELVFEPITHEIHLSTFGLNPVSIYSAVEEKKSQTASVPPLPPVSSTVSTSTSSKKVKSIPYWVYVATGVVLVATIVVVFMIFYSPWDEKKTQTSPASLGDSISKVQRQVPSLEEELKREGTRAQGSFQETNLGAIADSKWEIQDKKGFYIIVGQAATIEEAKEMAQTWRTKGFKVLLVEGKVAGTFRVSIGYYEQKEKALTRLNQLLREKKIPSDAWVYKKL